jgi:hypothetical protein
MKVVITESKLEQVAINWLNDNYSDLEFIDYEKRPSLHIYVKNKNVIFDYNIKTKEIFITIDIWKLLGGIFSMGYQQIFEILKKWVENYYNIKVKLIKPAENKRWKVLTSEYSQ